MLALIDKPVMKKTRFGIQAVVNLNLPDPTHRLLRNSISSIASEYNQHHRDRRWKVTCGYNRAVSQCAWSASYDNDWHKPLIFECPQNGFITGIESYYRKANLDRRFKFKCCNDIKCYYTTRCIKSAIVNKWKAPFDFPVPRTKGYNLIGIYSVHANLFRWCPW
ncbi:hemagglutinin/amebocyte aggregation factor-like [Montipora capricornis]|uniref:hemagglutinin/amebocyte aggregation factor-like n=1 Tax=Montipora capricornis TaxID=246305 RepID=UPI0035F129A0